MSQRDLLSLRSIILTYSRKLVNTHTASLRVSKPFFCVSKQSSLALNPMDHAATLATVILVLSAVYRRIS